MSYNESSKKASLKYRSEKQKRVELSYRKADFQPIKDYCTTNNIPVNTFIKQAIQEKLDRETKESSNEN